MKNKLFVDTNILVYLVNIDSSFHEEINKQFELLMDTHELWISRQVLREYIVVMTRKVHLENQLTTEEVLDDIKNFYTLFKVADETEKVTNNLIQIMEKYKVGGKNIHDANIVATMFTYDIPIIWTINKKDFKRYKDITLFNS